MRDLSNPLQALIAGAAKNLPTATGETERFRARMSGAGTATVILADASSSMDERAGHRRKIEALREAIESVWAEIPHARLVAFSSTPVLIGSPAELPAPSGGTALHLALGRAADLRPAKTIVISDGQPDDEEAALDAAKAVTGIIDVIFCGPDSDQAALRFMHRLARAGSGRVVHRDIARESALRLGQAVRERLALPAPGGKP